MRLIFDRELYSNIFNHSEEEYCEKDLQDTMRSMFTNSSSPVNQLILRPLSSRS